MSQKSVENLATFSCDSRFVRSRKRFRRCDSRFKQNRKNSRRCDYRRGAFLTFLFIFTAISILVTKQNNNLSAVPVTIIQPGLTVTIDPDSPLNLNLDAGVFNYNSQSLAVSTTSAGGYTIQLRTDGYSYTDTNSNLQMLVTTDLVNTENPTDTSKRIPTLTSNNIAPSNFNNNYGYNFTTLATDISSSSPASTPIVPSAYNPVPATSSQGESLATKNKKNPTGTEDRYQISYGAKVDNTVPAGTYQNTFEVMLTVKHANYEVTFCNNVDAATPCAETETQSIGEGVPTTLDPSTFTRTDYKQVGWTANPDGSGNFYPLDYNTGDGEIEGVTAGGAVTLYAKWQRICEANKICYEGNGAASGNTDPGMGRQTVTAGSSEAMLWPANFKRSDYGFIGWSTDENAVINLSDTDTSNDPTIFGPMETIALAEYTDFATEGLVLYATWIEKTGNLQNWTGCSSLTTTTYDSSTGKLVANLSSLTALKDERDDNTYAVARLADGNCWFIENLRLGGAADLNLTTDKTDINTDISITYTNTFTTSSSTSRQFGPVNTVGAVANMTSTNSNIYSYGNYYSWQAGIATTTTYSTNNQDAPTSICPKGWRLPTGGNDARTSNSDFYNLSLATIGTAPTAYDSTYNRTYYNNLDVVRKMNLFPNNLVTAGRLADSITYRGTDASYRTSTSRDGTLIYAFSSTTRTSSLYPGNSIPQKYFGLPVRCISRDSYTVKFNANGGSETMADQTFFIDATNNVLNENTFTAPTGKSFQGWATSPTGDVVYTDKATITTNLATAGGTVELYAIWQNDITSINNMQDMTSELCAATPVGTQVVLRDIRGKDGTGTRENLPTGDNEATYYVAKLADGNCWMTQNLDLNLSTTTALTGNLSDMATTRSWTPENTTTDTVSGETWTNAVAFSHDNGNDWIELTSSGAEATPRTSGTPPTPQQYIGNYYNWIAATAGSGTAAMTSGNASDSICPKGWKLPTGDTQKGSFYYLTTTSLGLGNSAEGSWILQNAPYYFILSGARGSNTGSPVLYQGTYGYWHSSSAANANEIVSLRTSYTTVMPQLSTYFYKASGVSIRCVARDTYTIEFNANGGTGTMPSQIGYIDQATELNANTFVNGDEEFRGWNTKADGSGTRYLDQSAVTNLANAYETITLYAEWGCAAGKICYLDNGAGSATTMSDQTTTSNTATMLWPSNFRRDGYGFAGWSADKNPDNSSVIYGPMQTITTGDLSANGMKLYAVWIKANEDLQNWSGCSALTPAEYNNGVITANLSSITALRDSRDGNAYAVARLADGKCWFIENLRLGGTENLSLTTNQTDVTADVTLSASTNSFATNNYTAIQMNATNTLSPVENMTTPTNTQTYSYGNYYSWSAAKGSATALNSGSATTSICPKGWTLPLGNNTTTSGSFSALDRAMGGTGTNQTSTAGATQSTKWRTFPNNYLYSGYLNGSSIGNRGSYGNIWSSTANSSTVAYDLRLDASNLYPGTNSNVKYYGFTVRCVARDYFTVTYNANGGTGTMPDQTFLSDEANTLSSSTFTAPTGKSFIGWNTKADGTGTSYADGATINAGDIAANATLELYAIYANDITSIGNMQDMTSALCTATKVGTETTLKDLRDDKIYYVAKLADGKCWMTQNLDLELSTTTALTDEKSDISATRKTWTPENTTQTTTGTTWDTSSARSYDNGESYFSDGKGSGTAGANNNYTPQNTGDEHYSLGNYYNWYAATAGTGTAALASGAASESICPKGWKLPAGKNDGEMAGLLGAYNLSDNATSANKFLEQPLYFVRAGYYYNARLENRGESGGWWLSTVQNATSANRMSSGGTAYDKYLVNTYYTKDFGYSIRCVARDTYTINFDKNGGSGAMPSQIGYRDQATELSANTFTNGDEEFRGWNTASDGSGTAYADKEAVTNLADANGSVTLYAQWGCSAGKICYFDNGASSPTKMSDQSASLNSEVTLWPSNFQRPGYGFAGWSEDKIVDATSTIYGPMQTLTATEVGDLSTSGKKFYAVWLEATADLQNWSGCDTLTPTVYNSQTGTLTANLNSVTALRDSRDGNAYAVARLTDGNCWFMENLRLGNATDAISLSNENTDITTNTVLPKSAATFSSSATAIQQNSVNTTSVVNKMSTPDSNIYSYGNYYSWAAAIGSTAAINSGSATTSICPKGWQLPTGSSTPTIDKSFAYLDTMLGGTGSNQTDSAAAYKYKKFPINMVSPGRYSDSTIYYRDGTASGTYWSSTAVSASAAYSFRATPVQSSNGQVNPGTYNGYNKSYGLAVRCVARDYFKISYDANGGTGTTETTAAIIGETATLANSTFTAPAGKSFVGWNTKADGSGTSYRPGDTLTDADTTNHALTLYAMYDKTIENLTTMQEMTSAVCNATPSGTTKTLTDTRDGKSYTVKKLADGKCWMTANLRLGNDAGGEAIELTSSDTDLAEGATFTLPASTGGAWATGYADQAGADSAKMYSNGDDWLSGDFSSGNMTVQTSDYPDTESRYVGNYYNWFAATAGTGLYNNTSTNVSSSICPKGWRLPTGGENSDYTSLYSANGSDANNFKSEASWVLSGFYNYTGSVEQQGVYAYLWSSTQNAIQYDANILYVTASTVSPQNEVNFKVHGQSVRCVARDNYTVKFDANGGTGTMPDQLINSGVSTTLTSNAFTHPNGGSFVGWTTNADGTGNSYADGETITTDLANTGETITLYAKWQSSYTVSFNANGGTGTMSDQTIPVGVATALSPNTLTAPAGKIFSGWTRNSDGSGDYYADGALVTNLALENQTAILYAKWRDPNSLELVGTMQKMSAAACAAASVGDEAQLRDTRDGKIYWIAKLADDKCWMTQNLDHDIDATKTYVPADTDLTVNWTPVRSTIDASNVTNNTISGWTNDYNTPYSVDPGNVYWNNSPFYASATNNFLNNDWGANPVKFQKNTPFASNGEHGHVGNYYNWSAALAMNDTSSYTSSTITNPTANPQTSICPKGWRLPTISNAGYTTNGTTNEFARLANIYANYSGSTSRSSENLEKAPLYFVRSGSVYSSQQHDAGYNGNYWSSSVHPSNYAYYLTFNSGYVDPTYRTSRYNGFNVRCVARDNYTVRFDANGGTGTMDDQIINTGSATKLSANTFTAPTGKVFVGWTTNSDGTGNSYANEAEVTTDLTTTGGTITLYAKWRDPNPLELVGTMQGMSIAACNAAAVGDTATLRDVRDNKTYNIRKTEDNNCWMVQNLDLGDTEVTLTPADSDVTSNFTIPASAIQTSGNTSWGYNETRVYDNGNAWIEPTSAGNNSTINTVGTPDTPSKYIGNYYNWYTATAGAGDSSVFGYAASSICPKGWMLPTGSTGQINSLTNVVVNITTNNSSAPTQSFTLQSNPNYFILSGIYSNGAIAQGSNGVWWSKTKGSTNYAYGLLLTTSLVYPQYTSHTNIGGSIRCTVHGLSNVDYTVTFDANGGSGTMSPQAMNSGTATNLNANTFTPPTGQVFKEWNTAADGSGTSYADGASFTYFTDITLYAIWQDPPQDITTLSLMQDMTPEACAATTIGTTTTLRDTRDDKTYNIRKMEDGKCWMVQNLALGSTTSDITITDVDSNLASGTTFTIPASTVQTSGNTDWSSLVDAVHVYDNGSTWIEPSSAGYNSTVNTTGTPDTPSKYIGNYYNWYTATAGTGTQSVSSGNATNSICPKGWKLPTGGANSDFTALTGAIVNITTNTTSAPTQSFTMQSSPNHFTNFGSYSGGISSPQGASGFWWSSTAGSISNVYSLYLNSASYIYPQNYGSYKYFGLSVRCIAE